MALAGSSQLILGLMLVCHAVLLTKSAHAWQHMHDTSYSESREVRDVKSDVIQPVVKKSAQLVRTKDYAHPRFRRNTLPIHYRTLVNTPSSLPKVAPSCTAWSQSHYRTFDGKTYFFHGACQYTLVLDCMAYTFRISIQNDFDCFTPGTGLSCTRTIIIHNGEGNAPIYLHPGLVVGQEGSEIELPASRDGLVIERIGGNILVTSGLGYKVLFDGDEAVTVYLTSESLRQQTCGLCGVYNDSPLDDFKGPFGRSLNSSYDFGLAWKEGEACDDVPRPATLCTQVLVPTYLSDYYKDFIELADLARETCRALENDPEFNRCHTVVSIDHYIEACQRDVCNCKKDQYECACNSLSAYAQECSRNGVKLDWRTSRLCPWTCQSGSIFQSCGTTCTQMCGSAATDCEEDHSLGCIEGCRCPADRYLKSDGQCVREEDCPCVNNGVEYESGSTISVDCNHCTCNKGRWTCTDKICETLCWASGDPHYKTFDDTSFNFMGECSYYLVKDCWDDDDRFEVIADNAQCGHHGVTCTQKVVIRTQNDHVKLFRDHRVTANERDVVSFPYVTDGIYVDQPTNLLTTVSLANGLVIRWDGKSRIEVAAPPSKFNRTCGLCGTFNKNKADDFMTPSGERVVSSDVFGNSWKVSYEGSTCSDVPPDVVPPNVCELYSQRRDIASQQCNKLSEPVFQPCHRLLNPLLYILDCLYDVCNGRSDEDHCPMFSQYVSDCRQKGVTLLDWRMAIPECGVDCPAGMSYSECAPSCGASCQSLLAIANGAQCRDVCAEGCQCSNGNVATHDGVCVPPDQCPCLDMYQWYKNGASIERDCKTCECRGGNWHCDEVTCPPVACSEHQVYSDCALPAECQQTCANINQPRICIGRCGRGCECESGYVLNEGKCIHVSQCPCLYRGEEYHPNEVRRVGCEVCTCENGAVKCNDELCSGICTAWGDPHYQTFDNKRYNFQGDCDYVLVTNNHYPADKHFHILVANVPCGSAGVTCTKAVTFIIRTKTEQEKVLLVRGKPIEVDTGMGGLSQFTFTESGLYIFVHTHIGVTLIWDRAAWVQVKVTRQHFNMVGGLCGNYNDLQEDDFLPPGGGIPLVDPNDFGNSWKVHDYCGRPPPVVDPCELNLHRKTWAQKKCGVITSSLFATCHEYVPPAEYFTNCVYDSCACDSGGDCECLCTAIAEYAQLCNERGVPIRWRSQDLCPIQCEGCLTYQPCIPVCQSSCENQPFVLPGSRLCADTCTEGCACPPGTILHNDECVEECPPPPTTEIPPPTTPKEHTTVRPSTSAPSTTPQSTTPGPKCECWGYGDPHYFDFNGVEFDDQGLCTYVLAQDTRQPRRFTVLIHNIECGMFPGTTCPREIEVLFAGHRIRMLAERNENSEYQVIVDGSTHTLPIQAYDSFTVTQSGLYMLFDAPSIRLQVRYLPVDLHYFKVEVPHVVYYNSTEGLCGNCGHPEPSCEDTGSCCDWLAPPSDPVECQCDVKPTECVPGPDVIEWCDKLYDDSFSECHKVVNPDTYHRLCLYNNCYARKLTCWDFEAYVTECSAVGICIDWREDHFCPYDCLNDQMHYRECACPDDIYTSCYPWDKEQYLCDNEPISGCFCNEGTMNNGNGSCIPCPTHILTALPSTTVESTQPPSTTVESTPPPSTTVESTPPPSTTAESTPPPSTTVESTPPPSTTVESTPPPSTTVESTPPPSTTAESIPPPSTTVESTPPPSTTVESTPPPSTTVESTPPPSTTVESTPPPSTTVESTPPASTTVESTPPPSTTVESTPPASTTVESTPPPSTTAESTPPPSTTAEEPTTTECTPGIQKVCKWSPYLNDDADGHNNPFFEFELIADFLNDDSYEDVCAEPESIECVLANDHSIQASMLTQQVQCSTDLGLTCYGGGPQSCLDYAIRILCCEERNVICGTTESPPSTTGLPPESTTVEDSTTIPQESTTLESTLPPSTTVESPTEEPPTTTCVPHYEESCKWTHYYDHNDGPHGDFEMLRDLIKAHPEELCEAPVDIECVLSSDHSVSAHETGQNFTCLPYIGFICLDFVNYYQQPFKCYDYSVRFQCCQRFYVPCGTTEETSTTEVSTKPMGPTIQPKSTTVETTTECVDVIERTCKWTPWLDNEDDKVGPQGEFELISTYRESYDICETPSQIECVLKAQPNVHSDRSGQVVTCDAEEGLVCLHSEQKSFPPFCHDYMIRVECCQEIVVPCSHAESTTVRESTTRPDVIESTTEESTPPPEESTTESESTTSCSPEYEEVCEWTPWLDDDTGEIGFFGEFELISSFREQYTFCEEPRQIECALKSDHNLLVNMTKQSVLCSPSEGLICLHSDQPDDSHCFDYSIRLRCCNLKNVGCPTTPQSLVTTVKSTTKPSTTAPPHQNEKCQPYMSDRPITLTKDGCSTRTPILLPECHGRCESRTMFDGYDTNGGALWKSICRCCRPSAYETDHYELDCPGGGTVTQPVDVVTECTCAEFECP